MNLKFLEDDLTRGFVAGVIGWWPQAISTHTEYSLHWIKYRYLDFAAVLCFNDLPQNFFETLLSEIVVIVFLGILGIGFMVSVKTFSNRNMLFKGLLYAIFCWFTIYAIITLYELKHIYPVDTPTAVLNLTAAAIWGLTMTWAYSFLTGKFNGRAS